MTPGKMKDPESEDPLILGKIEGSEIEDPSTAIKIEDPESYSNEKSGDKLDDVDSHTCTVNPPKNHLTINLVESIPSPHATISPLDLVQEVLRSPESPKESVLSTVDIDKVRLNLHGAACNSKKPASKFYGEKNSVKRYPYSEMRRKKSREVEWVRLGKSSLSKFDRDEIDGGSRLNDRHINHAQAMIKSQFSIEGLQCTLFQNSKQPPRNEIQIIHSRGI